MYFVVSHDPTVYGWQPRRISSDGGSLTSPPPQTPEEDSALFSIPQADVSIVWDY